MGIQLELFPNYPKIVPPKPIPEIPIPDAYGYPANDLPMAENTLHASILNYAKNALDALLESRKDAFVAIDLNVYYKEQDIIHNLAPDVLVVFGKDKEHRTSYIIHKEENISPQFVVEVTSNSNYKKKPDLFNRWRFYQRIGVNEYFVIHTKPYLWIEIYFSVNSFLVPSLDFGNAKSYQTGIVMYIENNELKLKDGNGNYILPYTEEVKMRKKIQENLKEEQEARLEAEEARLEAEEARLEAEEKATQFELRALVEKEARLEAEEARLREVEEKLKIKKERDRFLNLLKDKGVEIEELLQVVNMKIEEEED